MQHRPSTRVFAFAAIAALALVISGCAALFGDPAPEAGDTTATPLIEPQSSGGDTSSDEAGPAVENKEEAGAAAPAAPDAGAREGEAPAEYAAESGSAPAALPTMAPSAGGNPVIPPDQQFAHPLQAGEIDDNEEFAAYLQYVYDYQQYLNYPYEPLDISERHIIRVTNRDGLPVLGAEVTIYAGQSYVTTLRTTATGLAYFFPRAYGGAAGAAAYTAEVRRGQAAQQISIPAGERDVTHEITLNVARTRPPVNLDVLFLVDATGSMSDEIDELKDNMLSISAQIEALPGNPDVRFGLVYYRDRGDDFVVRTVDFTGNVQRFQRDLMDVYAGGGNDTPESLNEALHSAIQNVSWRVDDTVSLVFLVADAPPHLDYPQDYRYSEELLQAAQMGIKIFPIGSRLDGEDYYQKQAEYILRQMAQFTGGHFIFLTYEDTPQSSGEPGTEYSVPEGRYSVEDLDALVVKLVQAELETLTGAQQ